MDLAAHPVAVEELPLPLGGGLFEPSDLVGLGGYREHAGALPFDVEVEFRELILHAVEILHAHRREAGQSRWATATFHS